VGFIRFSVPGLLTLFGVEPSGVPIFYMMGVKRDDWVLGHVLGLMGLLGVVTGWLLDLKLPARVLRRIELLTASRFSGLPLAAVLCMFFGLVALFVFVGSNASFEDAIYTGEMRGTDIQQGTGKYLRLALLLISASVMFSVYLARGGHVWWIAMFPSAVATGSFGILGGRSLAAIPLVAAWLIIWYRGDVLKTSIKILLIVGIALLPLYSYLGQIYRGGQGLEGILAQSFSIAPLIGYMKYALWVDWGNLHSMAAATMIGPGVLGGHTFSVLLWPFAKFLGLPGRSAGVYMVETLIGFDASPASGSGREKWGFHATLIGDAYLNFGLVGVLAATIIFGIVMRILYLHVRVKVSNIGIYALAVGCSLRLFYVSIENFPHVLVILAFTVFVVQLGRLLTLRPAGTVRTRPRDIMSKPEWSARTRT
jgi:hypothetical protein